MNEQGNSFGYWLRRRRKALDLTQDALAQKVSCSQAAIKKIEAEERRPSKALALRLAEHLNIPENERMAFLAAARSLQISDQFQGVGLPISTFSSSDRCRLDDAGNLPSHGDQVFPFVGRNNEYGQFLGLIARLTMGRGQVVFIQGEAGIGKSRLLVEVAAYARQQGLYLLNTRCFEIERAIAYQPVVDLATQACMNASVELMHKIAPTHIAEIAALVPAMAERAGHLQPLSADYPEARQARLFQALMQLFDALARGRQLIVMIDDIQWADEASLQFLHFLARQVANLPILVVGAYRDEEIANNSSLVSLVESLRRETHAQHMTLARLGPADTETLLTQLNDPKLNSPDLATRLHRETDGNPFFLWSIIHSLSEDENGSTKDTHLPLPDALRDSVRVRLARVPVEDRSLLDLAAVLGHRFDFETLLTLTHLPEERFLYAMESLVMRRLLIEDPEWGVYDFSHDKVREVVYLDIGSARRVLLHRAVAEMLERQTGNPGHERDARLAEHFERGQVWDKAVHYLSLTAHHSQKLFAMRESLQWFDRAIALLQAHPDAASQSQQLAVIEQRGEARVQAGQTEGAVSDFQRVIDAARASGENEHARDVLIQLGMAHRRADAYEQAIICLDEALEMSLAMGDERHAADTLYHLGTVAWSNGRNDLAISYHQQAVDICERLLLTDIVAVQAFHGRGEAYFANGEPTAATGVFSRSLALARGIGDRSYESENLMMIGWACTGHMGLADYPRALLHFDAALVIARNADFQWHIGPTLIGRAYVHIALGEFDKAWADLNEVLPRLEALRLVRYQIMAQDALGSLFLAQNQPDRAVENFEHGLELAHDAGLVYWQPRLQANLVMAQLRSGFSCNLAVLLSDLQYAQEHNEVWMTIRCLEVLAESALAIGDTQACIAYADRLLSLTSQGDMREMMGQAHRLRGIACMADKTYEAARQELIHALALAEKSGQVWLIDGCHQALIEVNAALGIKSHEHLQP